MAGLQGVGKTTACGKLALALQKRNKRVLMVATDVYRPAAIDQLVSLGERINVRCLSCQLSCHYGKAQMAGLVLVLSFTPRRKLAIQHRLLLLTQTARGHKLKVKRVIHSPVRWCTSPAVGSIIQSN